LSKGVYSGTTRKDEEAKLSAIHKIAKDRISKTQSMVQGLQNELHELREVYNPDEKEGLAQWFNTDARFKEVRKELLRAERTLKKPYFGRIDFVDLEQDQKETYYIGKAVIAKDPNHPIVIDWRAPVASSYYEQNLGQVTYKVPRVGKRKIELERKRTYEIENDSLIDYYDTEVVANDELLTKYLSKNKHSVLNEIIATIQKEQNDVIRKNPRHNLLIQGSAGSGKTTVAMHRISYILYNYALEFDPKDFYIIGSNKVLLNYITGVLPDLDVYDVSQVTMEEMFTTLLYEEWDPEKYTVKKQLKNSSKANIKGTGIWFNKLSDYAHKKLIELINPQDIIIDKTGHILLTKSEIGQILKEKKGSTLLQLKEKLTDILMSRLETELFGRYYSYSSEEQGRLTRNFGNYFNKIESKKSVFDFYEEFIAQEISSDNDVTYEKNNPDLYDLAALAYLYKCLKENLLIREACHVVIDEAQDFGMMVYHSLKYCLSKCTFTIMGDVSQNINFENGIGDWEELKKLMLPNPYDYFGLLRKSYRNTIEISNFATDILRHGTFPIYPVEPIVRHGSDVVIKQTSDKDIISDISERINILKAEGYETIAVITSTVERAKELSKLLSNFMEINEFSENCQDFSKGVSILSLEYSKGLEFDAVIIENASKANYPKEDGFAKLLYVAVTRALHSLSVFYTDELTGLIKDPIPEDRKNISFAEDDFHLTPIVFEEDERTNEEIAKDLATEGEKELRLRDKYGPQRIEALPAKGKKPTNVSVSINPIPDSKPESLKPSISLNPGAMAMISAPKQEKKPDSLISEFGMMPDGTSLIPPGHGRLDNSVRWIEKDKKKIIITGSYGALCIIPLKDDTVKIIFDKDKFSITDKDIPVEQVKWLLKDTRDYIEVILPKLIIRVTKKTGAISFIKESNRELLCESPAIQRQYSEKEKCWWEYLSFSQREILKALNSQTGEWLDVSNKARYISDTLSGNEESILMSMKGYQLVIPQGVKTLLNASGATSPYLRFENVSRIEYLFRTK